MSDAARAMLEMRRDLEEVRLGYGAACVSLRAARDLAEAAREVTLAPSRATLGRLDAALAVWEAQTETASRWLSEGGAS